MIGRVSVLCVGLSIITALPVVLAGFMPSSTGTSAAKAGVNIEQLMKQVLYFNQNNQHQKAIDLLLASIDQHKEDALLRTLLVQTFDLFLESEIKQGQRDLQKNPKNKHAYFRIAGSLEILGDQPRAMEILLNGIRYLPNAPDMWMKIAKLELKADRALEALDVFREVARLDKKNSDAMNNAAYIIARYEKSDAEDLQEAKELATTARKLDPKNVEYLDTLAEVFFRQGNSKMATSLIEKAIQLAPDRDAFKLQLQRFRNGHSLIAE